MPLKQIIRLDQTNRNIKKISGNTKDHAQILRKTQSQFPKKFVKNIFLRDSEKTSVFFYYTYKIYSSSFLSTKIKSCFWPKSTWLDVGSCDYSQCTTELKL